MEALGETTTRGTVEEALRRAVETVESKRARRAAKQSRFIEAMGSPVELGILRSDEMWG